MMARVVRCFRGPFDEAVATLAESKANRAESREISKRSVEASKRLNAAVARNHFREAVEYQLRGGHS